MNNRKKTQKTLGRALAVMATIGSFVGLTSLPAFADEDTWTLEVNVTDVNYCSDPIEPATWSPDPNVYYDYGNEVDLSMAPGLVVFSVGLGLTPGYDLCTNANVDVAGDVEASVASLDAELTMEELDCSSISLTPVCSAYSLYTNNNSIMGSIDASAVATEGLKTGLLTVVWTPQD